MKNRHIDLLYITIRDLLIQKAVGRRKSKVGDYTQACHTRREGVSSAMDGKLKSIQSIEPRQLLLHCSTSCIHAGMIILDCVIMKSDKVELGDTKSTKDLAA